MVDRIFLTVAGLSISASIAIAAVLALRLLLKRAPKVFACALWALVFLRLLCPVTIESPVSLIPQTPDIAKDYSLADVPITPVGAAQAAYSAVGNAADGGIGIQHVHLQGGGTVTARWWEVLVVFGKYVWLAGVAFMLILSAVSFIRLRRALMGAMPLWDNVCLADHIGTPFVLGLFRPKIYLPSALDEAEQAYILRHERQHIRRGDHVAKLLAFAALCIHWFNPLVWLAFTLFSRDMEMACDEAVVRDMDNAGRANYAASLLRFAAGRKPSALSLAFAEGDAKERVKNIARYKKPAVIAIIGCVLICIIAAVCLLTSAGKGTIPQSTEADPFGYSYRVKNIVYDAPMYSFTYTLETAPVYRLSAEEELWVFNRGAEDWACAGKLTPVTLTADNFDDYFFYGDDGNGGALWLEKDLPVELRDGNGAAWRVDDTTDPNIVIFYYILLQKDGTVYLTYGYPGAEEQPDALIRWLFRLQRYDVDTPWEYSMDFLELAPGEEVVSDKVVSFVNGGYVSFNLTYARSGLRVEYGLRDESGNEYLLTAVGGKGQGVIRLPRGNYHAFMRNSADNLVYLDTGEELPPVYLDTGEEPLTVTGAMVFKIG